MLAAAQFALARSLWMAHGTSERSRELARSALRGYESAEGDHRTTETAIRTWLAEATPSTTSAELRTAEFEITTGSSQPMP